MIAGVVCLLLGFNFSETSCAWAQVDRRLQNTDTLALGSSAKTIALVAVGAVLLVAAGFYEVITTRSPILPPRLFQVGHPSKPSGIYRGNLGSSADKDHRHSPHNDRHPCYSLLFSCLLHPSLFPDPRALGHRRRSPSDPIYGWSCDGGDHFRADRHKDRQIPRADLGGVVLHDAINRADDRVG